MQIPHSVRWSKYGDIRLAVAVGFSTSYTQHLIFGLLLGVAGTTFPVGVGFASKWFSKEKQGTALGIYGAGNIGQSIAVLSLLLSFASIVPFTIGALGCAAALGLGNGAVFKLVPQYFPNDTATVTGLVGAFGGLGGFIPAARTWIRQRGDRNLHHRFRFTVTFCGCLSGNQLFYVFARRKNG